MGFFSHLTRVVSSGIHHVTAPISRVISHPTKYVSPIVHHVTGLVKPVYHVVHDTTAKVYHDVTEFAKNNSAAGLLASGTKDATNILSTVFNSPAAYVALGVGGLVLVSQMRR